MSVSEVASPEPVYVVSESYPDRRAEKVYHHISTDYGYYHCMINIQHSENYIPLLCFPERSSILGDKELPLLDPNQKSLVEKLKRYFRKTAPNAWAGLNLIGGRQERAYIRLKQGFFSSIPYTVTTSTGKYFAKSGICVDLHANKLLCALVVHRDYIEEAMQCHLILGRIPGCFLELLVAPGFDCKDSFTPRFRPSYRKFIKKPLMENGVSIRETSEIEDLVVKLKVAPKDNSIKARKDAVIDLGKEFKEACAAEAALFDSIKFEY